MTMSRTYRNRNSIPKGWTVRDDGVPYFNGDDKQGGEHRGLDLWYHGMIHRRWARFYLPMPRFRRSEYRKERKVYRKALYRKYRARVKNLMKHDRFEDIMMPTRTGGWESW